MIITYKYRLKLDAAQQIRVDQWIGTCRFVYNMSLGIKKDAYAKSISISFNALQKQLTGIKHIDWVKDVPSQTLQAAVQKLEKSYKSFFKGDAGFPKFLSKKRTNSILFKSVKHVGLNSFKLPKIGTLKVFNDRQPEGIPKTASIVRELGKYYLCVSCKVKTKPSAPCNSQIGIDVGISNFAVLSDGTIIKHPMFLTNSLKRLRGAQRKLSRAKKRSKNWYKQVESVKKIHQKVARQRQDFLQKLSTKIVSENDTVSVENLNIEGMVKSNLSRQISDSGWGYFKTMLKYKCELYEKQFIDVDPKYTSQECFICGHISKNNRKTQSEFLCENCGHANHADINGSQNILRRGQRLLAQSKDISSRLAKEPQHL